jgi:hypothetical protein
MHLHSSFVLLATLCSTLVSQNQLAVALPLAPQPKVAGSAHAANAVQDPRLWLALTEQRFQLPQVETPDNPQNKTEKTSAIPILFPDTLSSDALQHVRNIPNQFFQRADGALVNNAFVTAMFVVLIVVSVLIGAGVASIAVLGLDWKRYLARSTARKDLMDEHPVTPR